MSAQEPRTGGVAVTQVSGGFYEIASMGGYVKTPTHIAFPLAEAESLIDPNDPAVRERMLSLLLRWVEQPEHITIEDAAEALDALTKGDA